MGNRTIWSLVLTVALACFCPLAWAQAEEVVPTEDRDTIEAGDPGLPDDIPDEGARVRPGTSRTQVEEDHTVVPGDTLWDLCASYLNNPWYWPRVWSYNPEISNPHWIFPGQVVHFYPGGELPSEILADRDFDMPEPVDEGLEEEVPEDLISMAPDKQVLRAKKVTAIMLKRDAFITPKELEHTGVLTGSREEKFHFSEFDPVYVKFKNPGTAQVGKQFMIIRTIKEINHPLSGEFVGFYTRVMGSLQIVDVGEKLATAIIATSLDPIVRGDRVVPMMPKMQKNIKPRPNSVELKGTIIESRMEITNLGERYIVFIDQGSENGVQEGNIFDCVRREDGWTDLGERRSMDYWDEEKPIEIFGRVLIVDARPNASTGMVMASMRELRIGDRVLMSMK